MRNIHTMPVISTLTRFLARLWHSVRNLFAKQQKRPLPTKFGDFFALLPYMEQENAKMNIDILNKAEKPMFLFGRPVLESFGMITFGQYSSLCDAIGNENQMLAMKRIVNIIYPYATNKDIDEASVYDIFGFINFAVREVDRINKLFSSVHIEYTKQEKEAGIEQMQFGTFGILDWYAKRMGIHDQSEVLNERWVRIFQCMKNDTEETAFQRRLQKVYEKESRMKH